MIQNLAESLRVEFPRVADADAARAELQVAALLARGVPAGRKQTLIPVPLLPASRKLRASPFILVPKSGLRPSLPRLGRARGGPTRRLAAPQGAVRPPVIVGLAWLSSCFGRPSAQNAMPRGRAPLFVKSTDLETKASAPRKSSHTQMQSAALPKVTGPLAQKGAAFTCSLLMALDGRWKTVAPHPGRLLETLGNPGIANTWARTPQVSEPATPCAQRWEERSTGRQSWRQLSGRAKRWTENAGTASAASTKDETGGRSYRNRRSMRHPGIAPGVPDAGLPPSQENRKGSP